MGGGGGRGAGGVVSRGGAAASSEGRAERRSGPVHEEDWQLSSWCLKLATSRRSFATAASASEGAVAAPGRAGGGATATESAIAVARVETRIWG